VNDATPIWAVPPAELTDEDVATLIGAARLAPSLHNSQPWSFGVGKEHIEVYADASRQLRNADPGGRSLLISCGAALFNLRVAAEHLGFRPRVRLLPDAADPTLVAVVETGHRRSQRGPLAIYHCEIPRRHTNRRPFRNRTIPGSVLATLGEAARAEDLLLRIYDDPIEVARVVRLLHDADLSERGDAAAMAERRAWIGGTERADGIPEQSLGPRPAEAGTPFRDLGHATREYASFEATPTVGILSTTHDRPIDWVRSGQALERLLLAATAAGLSASFMNQPLEQPDLRWLVRSPVTGVGHSQMILRVGYGDEVPPTPRRPISELLRLPRR
jgi:nitroreductase